MTTTKARGLSLRNVPSQSRLGVVQVVAGLVQEEEVRGVQEGAAQLDAHLLAAGEGVARAVAVLHGEPQAQEAALQIHLVGVPAVVEEPVLDLGRGVEGGLGGVPLGHVFVEALQGRLLFQHVVEGLEEVRPGADVEAGQILLGNGGDSQGARPSEFSAVVLFSARQEAEEGGLARAVGAHEGPALPGVDLPVHAPQDLPLPVTLRNTDQRCTHETLSGRAL